MPHVDLCIIGSGSGNSLIDERFDDLSIALVDDGAHFGGTCLNVGCIPTKMFVLPADAAGGVEQAARIGVTMQTRADWPAIRDRVFGRIDPISAGGLRWREQSANVTVFRERGRFTGERRLRVGDTEITADRFVVAAGSRAVWPDIEGLDDPRLRAVGTRPRGAHTSDTIMRIDDLPERLVIVGGGFIAAEFAHVFSAFGVEVTVVSRSAPLLRGHDDEIARRFTTTLAQRCRVLTDTETERVERLADDRVRVHTSAGPVEADLVLVAAGRRPNSDTLDAAAGGLPVTDEGYLVVDEFQRTPLAGVFAMGDVAGPWQLKHVANAETRVVQHNLLHRDDLRATDHRYVPHAVFSDPQVAAVGLTEREARAQREDVVTCVQEFADVAYGWALEDVGHCVKLVAARDGELLGAHIIGPQASTLIQPLIQAMQIGLDAHMMARGQYWIHPALTEVVENALLKLELG